MSERSVSVSAAKAGPGREVVVDRQLGEAPRARAVGRHPAGEPGELEEELGRVEDVLRQHVREPRAGGVGELEHEQVLDAPPGAAQHHAAMRLGDAVEAGDGLLQQLAVERQRAEVTSAGGRKASSNATPPSARSPVSPAAGSAV